MDFLVSNNGNAYLLEGNIKPGIYWGLSSREDKTNTKKLIRKIISEIGIRVNDNKIVAENDLKLSVRVFPLTAKPVGLTI